MTSRRIGALAALAATMLFAAQAGFATTITSDFTNYDAYDCGGPGADASECWGSIGDAGSQLVWDPTGSLQMNEAGTGLWDWFRAPGKFLGDQSAFLGGTLSFDINPSRVGGSRGVSETATIVLHSSTTSIGYFLDAQPAAGTWNTVSAVLSSTDNWRVGMPNANNSYPLASKDAATNAIIASVLADLTQIWILGDWASGSLTVKLDNVTLAQAPTRVPAPGPVILLASALLGLSAMRRRFVRTC